MTWNMPSTRFSWRTFALAAATGAAWRRSVSPPFLPFAQGLDPHSTRHRAVPMAAASKGRRRKTDYEKLYLSIKEAASYVGIGENAMRQYVNSADPPPHMKLGKKVLVQKAGLAPYFEKRQEVI